MHLETIITRSANQLQNHPRRGISLQAQRSTSHVIDQRGAVGQWNSRQRRNFIEFDRQTAHQLQLFMKFSKIQLSMHGASPAFPASPVGRMLHLMDL